MALKAFQPASKKPHPLDSYAVDWFVPFSTDVYPEFAALLEVEVKEEPYQQFLTRNPRLLILPMSGGHGRWVLPKQKFGDEFVSDFIIGEKHSGGYYWTLVELERPNMDAFTKAGQQTAELSHAINQIQSWRSFLTANQNYATRPISEHGLGLPDITNQVKGLIILGRRHRLQEKDRALRRQIEHDLRIEIHSFDWLLDICRDAPKVDCRL